MQNFFNLSSFMSRSTLFVALTGLPLMSMAQHSVTVPIEIGHNSNPSLATDEAIGVTLFRMSPQYTLARQQGSSQTRFSFGGVLERSSNPAISNHRSDPNVSFEIEPISPVGGIGLRVGLSESSTREEEFTETGAITSDATQRNIVLGSTWRQQLSEFARLELGLGAEKVQYDVTSLVGFREFRAFAGINHDLVDEAQLTARWEGSRLRPDQDAARSSRNRFVVGITNQFSDTFRFVSEIGTQRISGLDSSRSPSALLRLEYVGERLASTFEWSRSSTTSASSGSYTRTRLLGWTASYEWSERTSMNFAIGETRSQGESGAAGSTWSTGLRHELNDFWTIEGRLSQQRTRPNAGGSGTANVVGMILTYSHPDF
jgi:hypothetical protein